MSEIDKEYLLHTRAIDQFAYVVTHKSIKLTRKQSGEIAQMNNTLRKAIHAQTVTNYWNMEGDGSHIPKDDPNYKKELLDAYTLFRTYRELFMEIQSQYTVLMHCLLSHERIIFDILEQTVLEFYFNEYRHELTIGEYLLKYADDAIFYLEKLNQKYIDATLRGFIAKKQLTVQPEPREITQLDARYTAFFNEVFAHTDDKLLPQSPPKGLFDMLWTQPATVIPGLHLFSFQTPIIMPFLLC